MKKIFIPGGVIVIYAILAGCSDPKAAKHILEDQGYSNIETTGHAWFGCGKDDTYSTGFNAKGPTGRNVSGVVCSGWLKGGTVRTF